MIRVRVTAKDIAKGERQSCHNCPVARALNRAFAHKPGRDVFEPGAMVHEDPFEGIKVEAWSRVRSAPRVVSEFVQRFDAQLPCKPFAFDLPEFNEADAEGEEWKENCECGRLVDCSELEDGFCQKCIAEGVLTESQS